MKEILCGTSDKEPPVEAVAQLSQELYNTGLLVTLIADLQLIDFEVHHLPNGDSCASQFLYTWLPIFDCRFVLLLLCSVSKLCLTLYNPMDCSTPGLPGPHFLLEFAQVHVHGVADAIQPSHPVALFSFCLQSFPASGSFPMSQLFASHGQIITIYILFKIPFSPLKLLKSP